MSNLRIEREPRLLFLVTETSSELSQSAAPSLSPSLTDFNTTNNQSIQNEEKETKELEWLIKTTSQLLKTSSLPDSSPLVQQQQPSSTSSSSRKVLRLMKSWSNRASKPESKAPHIVERLLQKLVQDQETSTAEIVGTQHYNVVLQAWSRSSLHGAAKRCELIISQMETSSMSTQQHMILHETSEDENDMIYNLQSNVGPNRISYHYLIQSYIRLLTSDQTRTKEESQRILEKIEAVFERMKTHPSVPKPSRETYNFVLLAYSSCSRGLSCGERAEKVFRELQSTSELQPDITSFNNLLGAWAKECSQDPELVFSKTTSILEEILNSPPLDVLPNADTFNHVLGIWLKRVDKEPVLPQMMRLLDQMKVSFYTAANKSCKPDLVTMNTILSAMVKTQQKHSDVKHVSVEDLLEFRSQMKDEFGVESDTITYNILMDSWCKSDRRSEAPEAVMSIYNEMTKEEVRTNRRLVDAYTYNCMIDCFIKAHRSDAPRKAEDLLERIRLSGAVIPVTIYNAVLNSWASSSSRGNTDISPTEAANRVKGLLKEMEDGYKEDPQHYPRPDIITYNTVLKAMADGTEDNAIYAEGLLERIERMGEINAEYRPDTYSYTSVISAYGRSDASNKASKALELLKRLLDSFEKSSKEAQPSVHAFNAALNACAFARPTTTRTRHHLLSAHRSHQSSIGTFEICESIYKLLLQHSKPDSTSYGTMLRACSVLLPQGSQDREHMVELVFKAACRDGEVSRFVMTQLHFAASPSHLRELVGETFIDIEDGTLVRLQDLPLEWTRNARGQRQRAKSKI